MDTLLYIFILFGLPLLLFLWTWFIGRKELAVYSLPENAEILSRAKKEVFGFKLATTILALICLVPAFFVFFILFIDPRPSTGSGAEVVFLIGLFLFIPIFLSFITIFAGYNKLCLVESDFSAKVILTIPFIPIFLALVAAVTFDITFVLIPLVVFSPQLVGWIVMLFLLSRKRAKFKRKTEF